MKRGWQPIFYPVLTYDYAESIARRWNTRCKLSSYAGFVTAMDIEDDYVSQFPVQSVGGRECQELWIAAEELQRFNDHLQVLIRVVSAFYGKAATVARHPQTGLPADLYTTMNV